MCRLSPLAPALPSFDSLGLKGFDARGWKGFVARAASPRAVVAKIVAETMRALKPPEVAQRRKSAGYAGAPENSLEPFADFIRAKRARWTKVVKEAAVKVD